MKIRLYRAPKQYEGYVDEYSLYFPLNKKLRKREGLAGTYVGCSQASDGSVIRCNWSDVDSFANVSLGRKVNLETMSPQFQAWAHHLEQLWNDALKYDDEIHWSIWNTV